MYEGDFFCLVVLPYAITHYSGILLTIICTIIYSNFLFFFYPSGTSIFVFFLKLVSELPQFFSGLSCS